MQTITVASGQSMPLSRVLMGKVLQQVACKVPLVKKGIEVAVIDKREIRRLNKLYRHKDAPTDVISFALNEGDEKNPFLFTSDSPLGEVYLCPEVIKNQAERFGIPYRLEFTRMLIHGVLHCAGYDHEKRSDADVMFVLQEKLVAQGYRLVTGKKLKVPPLTEEYFKAQFVYPTA
jgi:probable rRNA maturation factor